MLLKSKTQAIIFFVGIHFFVSLFGMNLDELQVQIIKEEDLYFKDFARSIKSDYVKYYNDENKLVLFACPSVSDDVVLGIASMMLLGLGFCLRSETVKRKISSTLGWGLAGTSFLGSLTLWYFIYEHYKTRKGFVPYLTFDAKGLQVFDKYVLEWENIDIVEARTSLVSLPYISKLGDAYCCEKEIITGSTLYINKFGSVVFTLYGYNDNLPSPVSYENIQALCYHCLAVYGDEKFRTVKFEGSYE